MNIVNTINTIHVWLHEQRDRWILWFPLPLACGIGLYFSLLSEPPRMLGGVLLMLGIISGVLLRDRRDWLLFIWLPVFLFILGFAAAQFRTLVVDTPLLERETYPLFVEGKVDTVETLPNASRIVIDDLKITSQYPVRGPVPERVRVKLKSKDPVVPHAGDRIKIKAVLLPLSSPVTPEAFDFRRHAYFKQIGATGYAISNLEILQHSPQGGYFFEGLRQSIRARIEMHIQNKDTAEILTAFLIGESKGISEKTWEAIRLSGIAHLLAISGFHITVLTGLAFFVLRAGLASIPYVALHYPIKKISAVASLAFSIFYLFLIGCPVPAVRAVIMAGVVMTAIMLDRDPLTLRLAAFAAVVVLLLQPESLVGPSFQLSFAAVVALIAFFESTRSWWIAEDRNRIWWQKAGIYFTGCLATTIVASLATAPFSLFHFSRVPFLAGLLVNMIAVPVTSIVTLPAGIIACLAMPFGFEKIPLYIAGKSLDLVMISVREAAEWPQAAYHADAWPVSLLVLFALGGLWLCIWRGRVRFAGLLLVAIAAVMIPLSPRADILASHDGDLFAVRDDHGKLWISSDRKNKFTSKEWAEREGGAGVGYWDDLSKDNPFTCTGNGVLCTAHLKNRSIDFIFYVRDLPKDQEIKTCDKDFTVSFAKTACANINIYDIWDRGAHAVYFRDGIKVYSSWGFNGNRPWTKKPWKKKSSPEIKTYE